MLLSAYNLETLITSVFTHVNPKLGEPAPSFLEAGSVASLFNFIDAWRRTLQLSIVICTKDRSASLSRLLCSLEKEIDARETRFEVLVVASGCKDDTESVAKSFLNRLPLRIVIEPLPGLSRARNSALANTDAKAILWLDDDTEVTPGFITTYIQCLEEYPEASYFGGMISPAFEGNRPRWISHVVQHQPTTFSLLDLGSCERILDPDSDEFPFGANMLVRRSALEGFNFREDLGRNQDPRNLVGGEETELFLALSAKGHHGIWVPNAEVLHWIPESRQTFRHFAAYQYAVGVIGVILLKQKTTPFAWTLYPQYLMLTGFGRLAFRPDIWVPALTKLQRERGRVAGKRVNKLSGVK